MLVLIMLVMFIRVLMNRYHKQKRINEENISIAGMNMKQIEILSKSEMQSEGAIKNDLNKANNETIENITPGNNNETHIQEADDEIQDFEYEYGDNNEHEVYVKQTDNGVTKVEFERENYGGDINNGFNRNYNSKITSK